MISALSSVCNAMRSRPAHYPAAPRAEGEASSFLLRYERASAHISWPPAQTPAHVQSRMVGVGVSCVCAVLLSLSCVHVGSRWRRSPSDDVAGIPTFVRPHCLGGPFVCHKC